MDMDLIDAGMVGASVSDKPQLVETKTIVPERRRIIYELSKEIHEIDGEKDERVTAKD